MMTTPDVLIDRYFHAVAREDARPGVHYQLGRQDAWRLWRQEHRLSAETEQMVMIWLLNIVLSTHGPERERAVADWRVFHTWLVTR